MSKKPKDNYPTLFDVNQLDKVDKKVTQQKEARVIRINDYESTKLKSVEEDFRSLSDKWL